MRIYLLRHGEAEAMARSDAERSLTANGRAQIVAIAELFAAKEAQRPERVLVSPYVRTQQSCDIFLDTIGVGRVNKETHEGITPDASPQACIDYLQQISSQQKNERSILLVTHQPFVSGLLELLTTGASYQSGSVNPPMLTSSFACLETDVIAPGCAELVWFSSPPHSV